jgi:hypothetical protein
VLGNILQAGKPESLGIGATNSPTNVYNYTLCATALGHLNAAFAGNPRCKLESLPRVV